MTISELISKLGAFPPDMRVVMEVMSAYSTGLNDVTTFSTVFLKLNQNDEWYYTEVSKDEADITALEVLS